MKSVLNNNLLHSQDFLKRTHDISWPRGEKWYILLQLRLFFFFFYCYNYKYYGVVFFFFGLKSFSEAQCLQGSFATCSDPISQEWQPWCNPLLLTGLKAPTHSLLGMNKKFQLLCDFTVSNSRMNKDGRLIVKKSHERERGGGGGRERRRCLCLKKSSSIANVEPAARTKRSWGCKLGQVQVWQVSQWHTALPARSRVWHPLAFSGWTGAAQL